MAAEREPQDDDRWAHISGSIDTVGMAVKGAAPIWLAASAKTREQLVESLAADPKCQVPRFDRRPRRQQVDRRLARADDLEWRPGRRSLQPDHLAQKVRGKIGVGHFQDKMVEHDHVSRLRAANAKSNGFRLARAG